MGKVIDLGDYKYDRIKLRNDKGEVKFSATNADAVSRAMFAMTREELKDAAKDNGVYMRLSKHFTKNTGHLRMIVGQSLREIVKKGKSVTIRGIVIKKLTQKVKWPMGYKPVAIKVRPAPANTVTLTDPTAT